METSLAALTRRCDEDTNNSDALETDLNRTVKELASAKSQLADIIDENDDNKAKLQNRAPVSLYL